MTTTIVLKVLGWVLPIFLGPLVYVAMRELLNVSARIDDLPPLFKRIAVVAFGTAVSAVLGVLGIAAPEACVALTQGAGNAASACAEALSAQVPVQGVTAAVVAMIIHAVKKSSPRS